MNNEYRLEYMKKKMCQTVPLATLTTIIIVTFMLGICNSITAYASTKDDAIKAYAKIMNNYLSAYNEKKEGNNEYDCIEHDINGEFYIAANYNRSIKSLNNRPVYRIVDYNKDGIPEMFIGLANEEHKDIIIYEFYTYKNNKPVRLMENLGYRSGTCILCKNGIIMDMTSGSAYLNGVTFHKMPKNNTSLKTVVQLDCDWEIPEIKKISNGKIAYISKKEYNKIFKKYSKPIKYKFYELTSKAINKAREAKTHYTNQKIYNLKCLL